MDTEKEIPKMSGTMVRLELPQRKGNTMKGEPLELDEVAGLSLTVLGVLVEAYIKEGYSDPTMYRAIRASTELAKNFKARLELDGRDTDGVDDLITNLELTAMESGEVVNRIIEQNGWQETAGEWSSPASGTCDGNCEHDGED